MNKKIEELYNKVDYQDTIINFQIMEISRLEERIEKTIKYLKDHKELIALMGTHYYKLLQKLGDEEQLKFTIDGLNIGYLKGENVNYIKESKDE